MASAVFAAPPVAPRSAVFAWVPACLLLLGVGLGRDLYQTNFDAFPTGQGAWVGTEGWATTGASTAAFGISDTAVPALGNAAYIGFHQPPSTFNIVYRPFDFDPVATNLPIVHIETILGIQDSTNGRRDQFFLGIRNRAGAFLAAIGFDNRGPSPGATNRITRLDGVGQFNTLETFDRNELHILYLEIDFASNTWSAELDGLFPIFTNAPFSSSGQDLDFGFLSCEWQLSSSLPAEYGDNFLLVGDFLVQATPAGTNPFGLEMTTSSFDPQQFRLSWLGEPGFQYELEYASRLAEAFQLLPGALYTDITATQTLQYVDAPADSVTKRVYRVRRSVQP